MKALQQRGNCVDEPTLSCIEPEAARSGEPDLHRLSHPPGEQVVEDHDRITGLQGQQQHFRFSRPQVGNKRKGRFARWLAEGQPVQGLKIRQVYPAARPTASSSCTAGGTTRCPIRAGRMWSSLSWWRY